MSPTPSTDVSVAVVMPAFDAAHLLPKTLPAALAAARGGDVIVVDPGSSDDTAAVAEKLGASVHRLGRRAGPAEARNAGVELTGADVVLFIDSDCEAAGDVVDRTRRAFAESPDLVSLTGSYDDAPADEGFFSLYMNLRHHFTHQRARREPATFWAGCGAVRRDAFVRAGGFDAERFPRPMIEDIELGARLARHGRCVLDPDLRVKHLKVWSCADVVRTDIFSRAVPWTRLIAEGGGLPDDLNLRLSQRIAAALAPLALASVAALPVLAFLAPWWCALPAAVLAVSYALSGDMLAFFTRTRGPVFAVLAILFHHVHLTYSAATFALVTLTHRSGTAGSKTS